MVAPTGTDNIADINNPNIHAKIDIIEDNKYMEEILYVNWYAHDAGIIISPYIKRPPILCKFMLITVEHNINIK